MTVAASIRKAGPFVGNGVTTSFPFTFKVFAKTDLALTKTSAAGVETPLALDSTYSVTLNADQDNNPGGTITYPVSGTPLPAGETLVAIGAVSADQGADISNAGRFLPQVIEDALDKLTILYQQSLEKVNRALLFPVSETTAPSSLVAATLRAGKFLAFDAGGNPYAASGTGADTALRTDLVSKTLTISGSALVGHGGSLNYAAGTIGAVLNDTVLNVKMFPWLAKGDGVTDDTAAIQACVTAAAGRQVLFPKGTYIVSSIITCPPNTQLVGVSRDYCIIQRTPTHTGHTFALGVDTPGLHAGAYAVRNLWLHRAITFNGGAQYSPGVSTSVDNRLTSDQAHLFVQDAQRGAIVDCTIDNMPYGVVLAGGAVTTIERCHFGGSIWDYQTAALQEGIAQLYLKKSTSGVPTLIVSRGNYYSGNFGSGVRSVTIGTISSSYSESVSSQYGLLVQCVEGVFLDGDYFGGHGVHSVSFLPSSTTGVCTNIKISGCFFDGARNDCINFSHSDAGGFSNLISVTGNAFNGETVAQRAFTIEGTFGSPSAYSAVFAENVVGAFEYAPIYIWGGYGVQINDNIVSAYNCRGGNTGDPAGAAGAYVVGSGTGSSDKVYLSANQWGGGTNTLGAANNCQYGSYMGGTFTVGASSNGAKNNGLGLGGGALVVGGDSSVHLVGGFAGTWVNFGGGFNSAGYSKDADGVVHLQGLIKFGVIGSAAFTLPAGFRPAGTCNFPVASNGAYGQVSVDSGGVVTPSVGSNVYVSLEGLSFRAA